MVAAAPRSGVEVRTDASGASSAGYPRKRRRTRRRLLRAGLEVLAERGISGVGAGEIASRAGVATATFYNHFPSVDDFLGVAADELGRGVEIGRDTLVAIEHDPAVRVAIGVLQLLRLADVDPVASAAFVAMVAARPDFRARVRTIVGDAITDGVEASRFVSVPIDVAINGVLGATVQSMRSRGLGEMPADAAPDVAALVLRMLGVASRSIPPIVSRAVAAVAAADADAEADADG